MRQLAVIGNRRGLVGGSSALAENEVEQVGEVKCAQQRRLLEEG